jgi:hypothetical protein
MRAVAVADVAGEGVGEGIPVEVVGVLDDELGYSAVAKWHSISFG